MNKYKVYHDLNELARKAHRDLDDAIKDIGGALIPDGDPYWKGLAGRGERAMYAHQDLNQVFNTLKEIDKEWAKVVRKLYKEYEESPWE